MAGKGEGKGYIDHKEYLDHRKNRQSGDPYFPEGTIHEDEFFDVENKHFVWDKAKNETNKLIHGIDFYTAAYVFNDANKLFDENDFVDGEQRLQYIGEPTEPVKDGHPIDTKHSKPKAIIGKVEGIILVVYMDYTEDDEGELDTDYENDEKEREIVIISARPAYPDEAEAYILSLPDVF